MNVLNQKIVQRKKQLKEIEKTQAISEARKIANVYATTSLSQMAKSSEIANGEKFPYKAIIRKFINTLYKQDFATKDMFCQIIDEQKEEDKKVLYQGKISEIPDKILDMNWIAITMARQLTEDYNKLEPEKRVEKCNLAFIIRVI